MSTASYWDALIWTRFSKPRCHRSVYQRVQQTRPRRIVELGIGDATRAVRMIQLAQRATGETVQYCGIDLFEARDVDGIRLKDVHHRLAQTGAKIRLVPGDAFSALGRSANILTDTDLLVIDDVHTQEEIQQAYHFFPRMLHAGSSVARFDRENGSIRLRWLKPDGFVQDVGKKKAA